MVDEDGRIGAAGGGQPEPAGSPEALSPHPGSPEASSPHPGSPATPSQHLGTPAGEGAIPPVRLTASEIAHNLTVFMPDIILWLAIIAALIVWKVL